jgi:hypothetical protein
MFGRSNFLEEAYASVSVGNVASLSNFEYLDFLNPNLMNAIVS